MPVLDDLASALSEAAAPLRLFEDLHIELHPQRQEVWFRDMGGLKVAQSDGWRVRERRDGPAVVHAHLEGTLLTAQHTCFSDEMKNDFILGFLATTGNDGKRTQLENRKIPIASKQAIQDITKVRLTLLLSRPLVHLLTMPFLRSLRILSHLPNELIMSPSCLRCRLSILSVLVRLSSDIRKVVSKRTLRAPIAFLLFDD